MTTPPPGVAAPQREAHQCWCGRPYFAGADGRMQHQTLYGHRPQGASQPIRRTHVSPLCLAERHTECGQGFILNGEAHACACTCGHPEASPRGVRREADAKAEPVRRPSCGTPSGRLSHLRAGERPCDDCRTAHANAMAERRAAKAGA